MSETEGKCFKFGRQKPPKKPLLDMAALFSVTMDPQI